MSGRVPDEEAQVEATDDWQTGAAADASSSPAPGGESVTAATIFAPGLVSEATVPDARGAAEG